jgi:ADP-ribosylglycohydrolase
MALASGDAIGKQTETLSREDVVRWYPGGVGGFEGRRGEIIPRYRGNKRREWRIGETTDDTERTIAVARAILRHPEISHVTLGEELIRCEKSVHPGVRSLWEFHQAGDPARIAQDHDGCGAAIRVAPVGVVFRPEQLDRIIAGAHQVAIPTHGGPLAIAAAVATAAGVSGAIEGWSAGRVTDFAVRAARESERRWPPQQGAGTISDAIEGIYADLAMRLERLELEPARLAAAHFPDRPLTIVPLAIVLATVTVSAEGSILLAANTGGDSDSVASIAGAIAGALSPETVKEEWYGVVEEVNSHDMLRLADRLALRRGEPSAHHIA